MTDFAIIYVLAGATLFAAIGWGLWQWVRVQRAKKNREHSAMAEHNKR